MIRFATAALLMGVCACSPRSGSTGSAGPIQDASPAVSTSATTRPAPKPPAPLPALASFVTLVLHQEQGGPSVLHCSGVVYDLKLDLAANTWTHRVCEHDQLAVRQGKLTQKQRADLETSYAKLSESSERRCGNDGGALSLTLTRADGSNERYVDTNWGCKQPPPRIAIGLPEFAMLVTAFTYQ